jgi:hypothetical protein
MRRGGGGRAALVLPAMPLPPPLSPAETAGVVAAMRSLAQPAMAPPPPLSPAETAGVVTAVHSLAQRATAAARSRAAPAADVPQARAALTNLHATALLAALSPAKTECNAAVEYVVLRLAATAARARAGARARAAPAIAACALQRHAALTLPAMALPPALSVTTRILLRTCDGRRGYDRQRSLMAAAAAR